MRSASSDSGKLPLFCFFTRFLQVNLGVVLLQFVHVLQHPSSVLRILQQGTHIQHVVQVSLDLYLQLLALCELQTLTSKKKKEKKLDVTRLTKKTTLL